MSKKTMTPFEQALLDATLEEFSDIPDHEEEIDVTFSKAFVEKLCHKAHITASYEMCRRGDALVLFYCSYYNSFLHQKASYFLLRGNFCQMFSLNFQKSIDKA